MGPNETYIIVVDKTKVPAIQKKICTLDGFVEELSAEECREYNGLLQEDLTRIRVVLPPGMALCQIFQKSETVGVVT
jgi:hypothetical protein